MTELICTEDKTRALLEINAWLREDPAHRPIFEEVTCTWRLATTVVLAAQPGATRAERRAVLDALVEEQSRTRRRFAN